MPADLTLLVPEFRTPVYAVLEECAAAQMPMSPFFTLRDPWKQARLWRQSRSRREVVEGIEWIRGAGGLWLADVIEGVGPQYGDWATNAAPGDSWHQWGEAVDCVAIVNGVQSWDTARGPRGGPGDAYYRNYSVRLAAHGLTSLGPSLGDWVHGQLRRESAPHKLYTWPEIDAAMRERFEGAPHAFK